MTHSDRKKSAEFLNVLDMADSHQDKKVNHYKPMSVNAPCSCRNEPYMSFQTHKTSEVNNRQSSVTRG